MPTVGRRSRTPSAMLSIGLLGTLLLSGCSSSTSNPTPLHIPADASSAPTKDAEAPGTSGLNETGAPSSSSSALPEHGRPKRPAGTRGSNAEAAILTAEYFLDLYDYSMQTGSTDELEKLSSKTCTFCHDVKNDIEALQDKGHSLLGGKVARSEGRINPKDIDSHTIDVFVDVSQASAAFIDESGAEVSSFEKHEYLSKVRVELVDEGWLVSEVFGQAK